MDKQLCGVAVLVGAPDGDHDCQDQMRELADRIKQLINDFEPRAEVKVLAAIASKESKAKNIDLVHHIFTRDSRPMDPVIVLDRQRKRARINGTWVKLTPTEFGIFLFLAENPIQRTRREIMEQIWSNPSAINERTLDVHIRRLRKAIGDRDEIIESIRSVGYRFNPHQRVEIK
jgi:DNA-binding response OmpR family regulator